MTHLRWLLCALVFVALTGAGFAGSGKGGKYLTSGAKLVLSQPVTIPANQAHVRFQGGEIKARHDQYYPSCRLESRVKNSLDLT